ncbi:Cabyr [Columba livia]|nr:Cabyr [Columba livia]
MQSAKVEVVVPHGLKTLLQGVCQAVIESNPDDLPQFFALYFKELVIFQKENPSMDITTLVENLDFSKENGNGGMQDQTLEDMETLFPGEPRQQDKGTDTEEDQLLEDFETEYSSKVTQCPSVPSFTAKSKSSIGLAQVPSAEGPELAYVPAEPAQLAAHVLGNTDSLYSLRDVAISVQNLYEDSQTSENAFIPLEGAAGDASTLPVAEASVEAVRSQPKVWSQSSMPGELVPSDSQAQVSTNYVNQASSVLLGEEPSPPSPLPPSSHAPKEVLQAVPSCNEAEVTSATAAVSLYLNAEQITDAEISPYVEQFPQKIIICMADQTTCLLKIKQPLDARQGSSATALVPSADDFKYQPECNLQHKQNQLSKFVFPAMASSEAGQLPPHCHVWTLYCLTDLSQKSPHSLPHAGAGVSAPIYVMQEACKRENAPPFILVGSNIHNTQDWKPLRGHTMLPPQDAGARKRLTVVPVPVAWPADEEPDLAEETTAMPCTPSVFFVAIPLDDVMSAKKGSPDGDKCTGINALPGSYSTTG